MRFDHAFASELADLASPVQVSPLSDPSLVVVNHTLLAELELPQQLFEPDALFHALFHSKGQFNQHAIAQKYGGHQFAAWNPQLGDGRGLLLCELVTRHGQRWDLHLKGAGQTPYSRFGDGRAALRSSIREYLASEALHALGMPTSRALCLISSDETIYRERPETAAMLIRVCQSHIRFGHFEYFYHTGQKSKLQRLFAHCFKHHFRACKQAKNPYLAMLDDIVCSTARLIAKWQAYGFNHGVMNTDNMSIHGITFDFGPYAFLDDFQPDYVCNHSDHQGRYGFDQQPGVALWNLNALAHAFTPWVSIEQIKSSLSRYQDELQLEYARLMRAKLGLQQAQEGDLSLLTQWLDLLALTQSDYHRSFRLLGEWDLHGQAAEYSAYFKHAPEATDWLYSYWQRVQEEGLKGEKRRAFMNKANPEFVLRNYLAQQAIELAEQADFSEFHRLLKVLGQPYEHQPEHQQYGAAPPAWGKELEISCSS